MATVGPGRRRGARRSLLAAAATAAVVLSLCAVAHLQIRPRLPLLHFQAPGRPRGLRKPTGGLGTPRADEAVGGAAAAGNDAPPAPAETAALACQTCDRGQHVVLPSCRHLNGPGGYVSGRQCRRSSSVMSAPRSGGTDDAAAPATLGLRVPCTVHHMGKDTPATHQYTPSWDRCLPQGCSSVFWTDLRIRQLVQDKYPEFLDLFDSMPLPVLQWDFARFLILHAYGGIYRDADFECVAPPQGFHLPQAEVLVVESPWKHNEQVQNSLMASVPGHAIWMDAARDIARVAGFDWCRQTNGDIDVLASTGPTRLEKWVAHLDYVDCVQVLPYEEYFHGHGQAKHHGLSTWVPQIGDISKRCGNCTDEGCMVRGLVCRQWPP